MIDFHPLRTAERGRAAAKCSILSTTESFSFLFHIRVDSNPQVALHDHMHAGIARQRGVGWPIWQIGGELVCPGG
jgi:hypothetical protein